MYTSLSAQTCPCFVCADLSLTLSFDNGSTAGWKTITQCADHFIYTFCRIHMRTHTHTFVYTRAHTHTQEQGH